MIKKGLLKTMSVVVTATVALSGTPLDAEASGLNSGEYIEYEADYEIEEDAASSKYTVLKDYNGQVYDMGGMEVYIRDWFSSDERNPYPSEEEKERYEYIDWIEDTYNFKVHTVTMGDWSSCYDDLAEYVANGGDNKNYVWTLYSGNKDFNNEYMNGVAYDLASLDSIHLSSKIYSRNSVSDLYTIGGQTYAMNARCSEPRTGIFFNKRLLREAGVNPDSIYDMQKNGTWTWDAFENILKKVQRDTNGDGEVDIWGLTLNEGVALSPAIFSNGGSIVSMDENGKITSMINTPNSVEAINWIQNIFSKYDWNGPNDEHNNPPAWDYFQKQFAEGKACFMVEQSYVLSTGNWLYSKSKDDFGFVVFPKGPHGDYAAPQEDNLYVIPGCYSAEKAWKIGFIFERYNEFNSKASPYASINGYRRFDDRAKTETFEIMGSHGFADKNQFLTEARETYNNDFAWKFGPDLNKSIDDVFTKFIPKFDEAIKEHNANVKLPAPKVSFAMQGYGKAISSFTTTKGATIAKPTAPKDSKAVFMGWAKDSLGKQMWNFDKDKVTKNTTLYAIWCNHKAGKRKVVGAKKATSSSEGFTGAIYCKNCGALINKGEKIPKLKSEISGGEYNFEADKDGKVSAVYEGATDEGKSSVKVPDTVKVNGKKYEVTEIAKKAFASNKTITKINLGKNIETIGDGAFKGCTKLTTVSFGKSVEKIGKDSFNGCKSLKTVKFPKNVSEIGKNAFKGCTKLKTLTIDANAETIAENAFNGCTALTSVTIPAKVNSIGKNAFKGCKNLKSVVIKTELLSSSTVKSGAFSGISAKATITVPKSKYDEYVKILKKVGINKKTQKFKKK